MLTGTPVGTEWRHCHHSACVTIIMQACMSIYKIGIYALTILLSDNPSGCCWSYFYSNCRYRALIHIVGVKRGEEYLEFFTTRYCSLDYIHGLNISTWDVEGSDNSISVLWRWLFPGEPYWSRTRWCSNQPQWRASGSCGWKLAVIAVKVSVHLSAILFTSI